MARYLNLLALPVLLLAAPQDRELDDDLEHYLPGADRLAFESSMDWRIPRLTLTGSDFELELTDYFDEFTGESRWLRRVRDLEIKPDPLVLDRDYEDVQLWTSLDQLRIAGPPTAEGALVIYGGLERDRLRFVEMVGGLDVRVPKRSPLDPDGLVALRGRADLSSFAPPASAVEDDATPEQRTYDVPVEALDELLFPLGHPAALLAPQGWSKISDSEVPEAGPVEKPRGSVEATWVPGIDGSGRIELDVEVTFELDPVAALSAAGQAWMDETELESVADTGSATGGIGTVDVQLQGKGHLTWDAERERFLELDLPLEFEASFRGSLDWDQGTMEYGFEVTGEVEGDVHLVYGFEPGKQPKR